MERKNIKRILIYNMNLGPIFAIDSILADRTLAVDDPGLKERRVSS